MVTPTRHNARAAGAVVLAMAAITASDALVKGLLEEIKPSQFIFVRALVILLILGVALTLNNQRIPLPSLRQPWPLVRGGCELLSTSLWLFGLQFIALPTAAALAWTSPIMVTLLGIVILREANSLWRWVSVLIGFIGVLSLLVRGERSGVCCCCYRSQRQQRVPCGRSQPVLLSLRLTPCRLPSLPCWLLPSAPESSASLSGSLSAGRWREACWSLPCW